MIAHYVEAMEPIVYGECQIADGSISRGFIKGQILCGLRKQLLGGDYERIFSDEFVFVKLKRHIKRI